MKGKINPDNDCYDPSEEYFKKKDDAYKNVLEPISKLSSYFHETFDHLLVQNSSLTKNHSYQEALLYLLLLETSCFRYWGQGKWTEYAKTIFRKGEEVIRNFEIEAQKS